MAGGGGRPSDRARATAVQSTIQSIKEVVGGHSDADIYAALRESNMDPNETAQKLLNQDPFHEVKRKRDKKREIAGQKSFADTKELVVQAAAPWAKSQTHWIQNDQRRVHNRNQSSDAGLSQEFRIVRDNRLQQGAVDHRQEPGRKIFANVKVPHQRVASVQSDQGHILEGAKNNSSSEVPQAKGEVQGNPERHTKPYLKDSMNRWHFSNYDTVDVPYLNSKAAVTVETIQHQVRGVTRQPSRKSVSQLHVSSSYSHAIIQRGDFTSTGPSGCHSTYMSKNIQSNQRPASGTAFRGRSIGSLSFVAQNINKYHHGVASNLKAIQPNKQWKPKVIKNPSSIDVDDNGTNLESPSASKMGSANVADSLSDKISHANIHGKEHVIIPEHLCVPDYEHARLKFGSFTTGLDSDHEQRAASPESENSDHVPDSGHLVIGVDLVDAEHDEMDEQARSSQHDQSTSTAEISIPPSDDGEHMNAHEFGNDDGLGLVRSGTPLMVAPDERNIQNTSSLPTFSAYGPKEPQVNNDVPLYGLVEPNVHPQVLASSSQSYPSENPEANNVGQVFRVPEHNVHSQVLHSTSEALSSQLTSGSPAEISLQQQLSQPHPAAQSYPPVHVQHFPNFMPYHRPVYSPVYVPPMAMPNYSTNVAYPHPSNGNNYLQMPGGSSHLTAGGMKYGPSQYNSIPVGNPSGYGNYTHPAGFTISSPGVIGGTVGLDDVNSINYKDNNVYASAQQVETSDTWIQTPREIPALQSSPYYNLTGQATPGAYLANPGNASFGATAQTSHAQFPGLYHPQQPPSIVSPQHVVHQQVPSAVGANVGIGVAAPGPLVGAFQQLQIGHQNWRGNF